MRGSGEFRVIEWDEARSTVVEKRLASVRSTDPKKLAFSPGVIRANR